MSTPGTLTVLIVEDGDEYLENLERFVPGPTWLQAHNGEDAVALLRSQAVDLVYLDMRFDRIPRQDLLGDHARVTREQNGDPARAWRHLQNHQGLYILAHLDASGFGDLPVIVAYDFSRESRRFEFLRSRHPRLAWVPDAVTPDEIRSVMARLIGDATR